MPKPTNPSSTAKPLRSDGAEARNRLLDAAMALFAEKGFAKTSTREIALAAQVNIASISYYFGDKAGLYRAVFTDPRSNPGVAPESINDATQNLRWSVNNLLRSFVEPLKKDQLIQQCMKLHFREMLEPTGVWQEEVQSNIKPAHDALVAALCRHLNLAKADDDIHRLAFSISGLGVMLHVGHDIITMVRPQLLATHAALDKYCNRLVDYAIAMVDAEARLRKPAATRIAKTRKGTVRGAGQPTVHTPSQRKTSTWP
jgi:AcrR family transcriptional regulator